MGFFGRKRIKILPGVYLNASTKGLGISAGIKGLRISSNTKGETYLNAGRYGVYYRQKLNTSNSTKNNYKEKKKSTYSSANSSFFKSLGYNTLLSIEPEFTGYCNLNDEFLAKDINTYIKATKRKVNIENFDFPLIIALFLFLFGLIWHLLLVFAIITLLSFAIYKEFVYEPNQQRRFNEEKECLEKKAKIVIENKNLFEFAKFIYSIKDENTFYNANNGYNIGIGCGNIPKILDDNVTCFSIMGYYLFFIDNGIIIRSTQENEPFYYYDYSYINFYMYEANADINEPPECCNIIKTTWKYVKKDGTPNLRYKDNPQIDTVKCNVIVLDCDNNFRIPILFLNLQQSQKIFDFIESITNVKRENQTNIE